LRTKDPKEAKRLAPAAVARLQDEFAAELESLRRGDVEAAKTRRKLHKPSPSEIEAVAWELLQLDLRDDERGRFAAPMAERRAELIDGIRAKEAEAALQFADPKQAMLATIANALDELAELDHDRHRKEARSIERDAIASTNPQDQFAHVAQALVVERGWDMLPGSPEFTKLCHILRSSRLAALKAMAKRDTGDFLSPDANPEPPARPVAKVAELRARAKPGESLRELLPQYLKEEGASLSSEEIEKKKKVVALFAEFVGDKRAISSISRADFRDFKRALEHWPRVAKNQTMFKGKDFRAIVELNKKHGGRAIGPATVNNYLSSLGAYFGWLYQNGYTSEPKVTQGLLVKHDKAAKKRNAYAEDELQKIFDLPLFKGCASQDELHKPGDVRLDDWRFWIPVICLHTGARLGEIAQLRTQDLKKVRGHWAFHITDEGEGMTTKTAGSVRIVPVHPELKRLGLLAYHARMAGAGNERLFPELVADQHGRYAGAITGWWREYLERFKIDGSSHYRFRHTFADALRAAGHLDEEVGPILGHKTGSTTERYGNLPQVTIDRRAEIVAAAKYPIKLRPRRA
jgi:integrase